MRIYTERPKPKTARQVWDLFVKRNGKNPIAIWFNAQCWHKRPSATGGAWAMWVADYGNGKYDYTYKEDYANAG